MTARDEVHQVAIAAVKEAMDIVGPNENISPELVELSTMLATGKADLIVEVCARIAERWPKEPPLEREACRNAVSAAHAYAKLID